MFPSSAPVRPVPPSANPVGRAVPTPVAPTKPARIDPTLSIGQTGARVISCPSCDRPLAAGTVRCPSCRTWLVKGRAVRRSAVLPAVAVVVIAILGMAGTATAISVVMGAVSGSVTATPGPSALVTSSFRPGASPIGGGTVTSVPAVAQAALNGTTAVNRRMAADAAALSRILARKNAQPIEIARRLRSLASDALIGIDVNMPLATWPAAEATRLQLDEFYRAVGSTARNGLRVSLADAAAYRRTGAAMMKLLAGLPAVDAASRTLAATAGIELPPLVDPSPAP
jgi:hypothetical protein